MKKISILLIGFYLIISNSIIAQTIKIVREIEAGKCILGKVYLNDKLVCYSLEKPDIGNINDISAISAGTFSAFIRTDNDKWRIELKNVPGDRTVIQIHKGNSPSDIKGCIIVCTTFDENNCTIPGGSSTQAMESFKNALYEAKISDEKEITVIVENNEKKSRIDYTGEWKVVMKSIKCPKFPQMANNSDLIGEEKNLSIVKGEGDALKVNLDGYEEKDMIFKKISENKYQHINSIFTEELYFKSSTSVEYIHIANSNNMIITYTYTGIKNKTE